MCWDSRVDLLKGNWFFNSVFCRNILWRVLRIKNCGCGKIIYLLLLIFFEIGEMEIWSSMNYIWNIKDVLG